MFALKNRLKYPFLSLAMLFSGVPGVAQGEARWTNNTPLTFEICPSLTAPILGTTGLKLVDPLRPETPAARVGFNLAEPCSHEPLQIPPGMAVDFDMNLPDDVSQSVRYELSRVGGSDEQPFGIALSHVRKEGVDLLWVTKAVCWRKCPYRMRLVAPGSMVLEKKPTRMPGLKKSMRTTGSSRLPSIIEGPGESARTCVIL